MAWLGSDTTNMASTSEVTMAQIMTVSDVRYALVQSATGFKIVDKTDDDFVVFCSHGAREATAEFRRLTGTEADCGLWELDDVTRYFEAPPNGLGAAYTRVHVRLEACDKNIDRVRALYRKIKGRELDESQRGHEYQGFYRYPPGPRNEDPDYEKRFGSRIEYRARFFSADKRYEQHDSRKLVINLLYAGYDLGINELRGQ